MSKTENTFSLLGIGVLFQKLDLIFKNGLLTAPVLWTNNFSHSLRLPPESFYLTGSPSLPSSPLFRHAKGLRIGEIK